MARGPIVMTSSSSVRLAPLGMGVDDLRWMNPVRPDETLHVEDQVIELIPSRTNRKASSGSCGPLTINWAKPFTHSTQSAPYRVGHTRMGSKPFGASRQSSLNLLRRPVTEISCSHPGTKFLFIYLISQGTISLAATQQILDTF
jgi:hypothetical protein